MSDSAKPKRYDLEERSFIFAKKVSFLCGQLLRTIPNLEYIKQVVRSSGSVGANYIEANESLTKKDFSHRIRICLKEAKETAYWLRLLQETNDGEIPKKIEPLIREAIELKKIFSAISEKSK